MNKQTGFTLIELVAVLVILALLGAMAVPRFASIQNEARDAALNGSSNAVKSALSISIAQLKRLPTVAELALNVGGDGTNATAVNTGVQVTIAGTNYIVPTYTDTTCTSATGATTDTVACVGAIPLP